MAKSPPNPVFTLKGLMRPVHCLLFDLNEGEEFVYAGTQKGEVHVWNLKCNREVKCHKISDETCLALHKIHDNTIITQDKNGIYKVWLENETTKDWSLIRTFTSTYYGFCKSVIADKNEFILCPVDDSGVKLIYLTCQEGDNCTNDEMVFRNKKNINEKLGEVMVIRYFNNFILVAYESGVIKIWSVHTGKCESTSSFLSDCPMALDVQYCNALTDKLFGFIGTSADMIIEFNICINTSSTNVSLTKRRDIKITNPGVSCIAIRPDCKLFAAGCWDKRIRLFSCKSLKLLVVLDFHKDIVQDVLFSYDKVNSWSCQCLLAAGCMDGRISLWDLYN